MPTIDEALETYNKTMRNCPFEEHPTWIGRINAHLNGDMAALTGEPKWVKDVAKKIADERRVSYSDEL